MGNSISFEMKVGDIDSCPITEDPIDILVKASSGEHSTGWLSIPILEKCLAFLKTYSRLEGKSFEDDDEDNENPSEEMLKELQLIRRELEKLNSFPRIQPPQSPFVAPGVIIPVGPSAVANPSAMGQASTPSASPALEYEQPRVEKKKPGEISQRDKIAKKKFAEEIVELVNNPPTDDNPMAKSQGLSEIHIREIVGRWKNLFEDKTAMYPVLQNAFGMTKERFETILKMPS